MAQRAASPLWSSASQPGQPLSMPASQPTRRASQPASQPASLIHGCSGQSVTFRSHLAQTESTPKNLPCQPASRLAGPLGASQPTNQPARTARALMRHDHDDSWKSDFVQSGISRVDRLSTPCHLHNNACSVWRRCAACCDLAALASLGVESLVVASIYPSFNPDGN